MIEYIDEQGVEYYFYIGHHYLNTAGWLRDVRKVALEHYADALDRKQLAVVVDPSGNVAVVDMDKYYFETKKGDYINLVEYAEWLVKNNLIEEEE